jgi:hypothetical protein
MIDDNKVTAGTRQAAFSSARGWIVMIAGYHCALRALSL